MEEFRSALAACLLAFSIIAILKRLLRVGGGTSAGLDDQTLGDAA